MKGSIYKDILQLFQRHNTQPVIVPKQGVNPPKKGFGVPTKTRKARRKAAHLRQKHARRVQR